MISLSNIQAQASQVANLLGLQGQWNLLPTRYNGIDIQVFGSTGILDSIENFSLDDPNYFADVTFIGDFSQKMLKPGGTMLMKIFHGPGFDDMVKQARLQFEKVVIRKPQASRARSRETYLLAKGYGL